MEYSKDRMIYQTEKTRTCILEAAWKLFMEKGFFDTQMKDVATATGLSRTSLYRYYQDKIDLAMALVERIFENFRAQQYWKEEVQKLSEPVLGVDKIACYLKYQWLSPHFQEQFLFLAEFDAYYSGSRIPANFNQSIIRAIHGTNDPILEGLFSEGQQDGSIRRDLDPHLTIATILNAVRALQQRVLLRGKALVEVCPEELEKMPAVLVDLIISAICNNIPKEELA
jgi:AcrR family transcriptional regulator